MGHKFENFPVIPIEQFQENFDEYMEDIEENKSSYIIETEDGQRAVMVPADDDLIKMYTDHEEGC